MVFFRYLGGFCGVSRVLSTVGIEVSRGFEATMILTSG